MEFLLGIFISVVVVVLAHWVYGVYDRESYNHLYVKWTDLLVTCNQTARERDELEARAKKLYGKLIRERNDRTVLQLAVGATYGVEMIDHPEEIKTVVKQRHIEFKKMR